MNVGTVMIAAQPEILRTTSFCSALVDRHVGLQDRRQQVALGDDLLVDELQVVVDVAEVLPQPSLISSTPPWVIAAAGPSSGCTAR